MRTGLVFVIASDPNLSVTYKVKNLLAIRLRIPNCTLRVQPSAFVEAGKLGEVKDYGLSLVGVCQFPEIPLQIDRHTSFIDFTSIGRPTDKYSCIRSSKRFSEETSTPSWLESTPVRDKSGQ